MQKLTFEQYSALSHSEQVEYCQELAWRDLVRRNKSGKPITQPTVSGLFRSTKEIPELRIKQWEIIGRLSAAGADEVLFGRARA